MAPNDRQERRLLRQRGAGTRELKNASFGFTFGPAPLQAQPSSRRTPRPLPPQRSSRRTPQPLAPRPSSRKTPAASSSTARRQSSRSVTASSGRATGVSKRGTAAAPGQHARPPFTTPNVTGKRKRGEEPLGTVEEADQDELERDDEGHRPSSRKGSTGKASKKNLPQQTTTVISPLFVDAEDELEVNDEAHRLSSDRKRRRVTQGPVASAGTTAGKLRRPMQPTSSNPKTPSSAQEQDDELESPTHARKRHTSGPAVALNAARTVPRVRASGNAPSTAALETPAREGRRQKQKTHSQHGKGSEDELSPERQKLKQRTRSQPQQSLGSEDELSPKFHRPRQRTEHQEEEWDEDELSPEQRQHHTEKPATASASQHHIPAKREAQPSSRSHDRGVASSKRPSRGDAGDGEREAQARADETRRNMVPSSSSRSTATQQAPRRSVKPSRPSSSAQAAKRPRGSSKPTTEPKKKRKKPSDPTAAPVPITVYRLHHPTNTSDVDELQSHLPPTRLGGPNPIDVLAQITSEITTHLADTLTASHAATSPARQPHHRASLARKRAAVASFQAHLSDALFALTEAMDVGTALAARVRAVTREKVALREELLRVREEREEVARRMDRVRRGHARRVGERRKWEELSGAVSDVEVAVQRGRERAREEGREGEGPEVGVGGLLEEVVGAVSSSGPGGGLLEKVKRFNAFMERAAGVLEGRMG